MLHDIILATAGPAHPRARTRISDAARDRWVRTMHGHLTRAGPDGTWFGGDLDVAGHALKMAATRQGAALTALWGAGPLRQAVAASVLLAGRHAPDDAAAVAVLRRRRLPIGDGEYRAMEALSSPCLVTVYFDAHWYDNARVELAATSLALAALYGPDASLKVLDAQRPAPRATDGADAPPAPLPFDFTRERLRLVMGMVTKKMNAVLQGRRGAHFTVRAPDEYLSRPGVLRGPRIFEQLKDTVWRVRWYDRREDRLCFGDFLGFLDQVRMTQDALPAATSSAPADGQPVKLRFNVNSRQLVTDANIRRLLGDLSAAPPTAEPVTAAPFTAEPLTSLPA